MSLWAIANWHIENNTQYICDYLLAHGARQSNILEKSNILYHRTISILYQGSIVDKNANTKCVSNISAAFKVKHNSKHAESY